MKKDNQKPSLESSGESKAGSTALTLQQLNKETEKKESAAEAMRVRCKICFKETAPNRRCFGHGGSGGGGSDSGKSTEEQARQDADLSLSKKDSLVDEMVEFISIESSEELDVHLDEDDFDPNVIAELIAQGLLVVNNDREARTLSIELKCEPKSLTEEQRMQLKKFMQAVIKQFNALKEQHSLSDECLKLTHDKDGNILSVRINLPTLALYDALTKRLADNLQPTPKNVAPTPLSMEPKPTAEMDEEEQELFNPSPFKIDKMDPW